MKYEPTKNDIRIIINIKGDRESTGVNSKATRRIIDPKLLIQVFDSVENALYESDRDDVQRFFQKYQKQLKLSNLVRDAAIHRVREHRHNRLLINDARSGSIEIETIVMAFGALVLGTALKETLLEAYKNSIAHKVLAEYITEIIDRKTLLIAELLRKAFAKKKRNVEVVVEDIKKNEPKTIGLTVDDYEILILNEIDTPKLTIGEFVQENEL